MLNLGISTTGTASPAAQQPAGEASDAASDDAPPSEEASEGPASEVAAEPVEAEASAEQQAIASFQKGRNAYSTGDYQVALEHFQDAQGLHPSPDFHYNIGQCYESLENYEQAITSYRAYLRSSPGDQVNIENKIDRLDKRLEEQRRLEEQQRLEQEQRARAQGEARAAAGKKDNSGALVISGSVLAAVGAGAAVGLGTAFGLQARDRSKQMDELNAGNPAGLTLADARTLDADGKKLELIQIVSIGIGGAVAISGIALLAAGLAKRKKSQGSRHTDQIETHLVPTFGPQGAGFSVSGRF